MGSLLLTAVIDAHEGRYVAVCDIPGEYLRADTYEEVIMVLEGHLVEHIVMMSPDIYQQYIHVYRKKKI